MKNQILGRGELVSSRLAYGCMRIAGTWNRSEFNESLEKVGQEAVQCAYEAGYTHFDHADIYGVGISEEIFGRVLKKIPEMRRRVLIATKCGIRWKGEPDARAPHRWDFSREHILRSCEGSLKRLGIDCIDLFMLHRPDFLADPQEIAGAFSTLKKEGKVKEFGVSNFRPSLVSALQKACPMPLVCNQVEIHIARLDCFEDGTLDQCLEEKISPVSWSPLAQGLLSDGGKVDPKDRRVAGLGALLSLLDEMAAHYGVSRSVLCIAWLLKHPAKIIPIVGSVKPERIQDAVKADALELSREDWYSILVGGRMQGLP
jgi:predicted oxidoreductase